jgi:hypothetical protein
MVVTVTPARLFRARRLALGLGSLLFMLGPGSAHARRISVTCTDGTLGALVRDGSAPPDHEAVCDLDADCDGTCSFGFCGLGEFWCAHAPACVGPGSGVCAPGVSPTDVFTVPARQRSIVPAGGTTVVLRCRRCRPTSTTTTTIPCAIVQDEVCGGDCPPGMQCVFGAGALCGCVDMSQLCQTQTGGTCGGFCADGFTQCMTGATGLCHCGLVCGRNPFICGGECAPGTGTCRPDMQSGFCRCN